jgi:hypothetical protein
VNNNDIDAFFRDCGVAERVQKEIHDPNAVWTTVISGFPVLIRTQESANRMRIMAAIAEAADISKEDLYRLLEANYHSTWDVRYAIANGAVVSVFMHPLAELNRELFARALFQVVRCAETFGGANSSVDAIFLPVDESETSRRTPSHVASAIQRALRDRMVQ